MSAAADLPRPVLHRADRDGIATLTLDRPRALNALSDALIDALSGALAEIATNPTVRVVVLCAPPGPVFCAGHDLKEMTARRADADRGRAAFADTLGRCAAMMQAIVALPQPVIAAVEGLATAGENAAFCTPGVHIGLFCSTPMVALSRNVAPKHAMEMLLTGATVSAADAARMGLVNRVVPAGTALDAAQALAATIAAKAAPVLAVGKRAFYAQAEMGLAEAYAHAAAVMVENMLARDAQEGIGAFLEKREPQWR